MHTMNFLSNHATETGCVPDFVIAGAAKAGTTALHLALSRHPQVFMPERKEPDFFAQMPEAFNGPGDHVMRNRVTRDEEDYAALFAPRSPHQLCGEASVSYLYFHDSAARIAARNPDARIIIVLRNPVDRAYSQYMFNRRDLREPLPFAAALECEDERSAAGWAWAWQYRKVGLYSEGVGAYLRAFGPERVFIGLYDELKVDTRAFMDRILGFLGLDNDGDRGMAARNKSGEPRNRLLQRAMIADSAFKKALKAVLPLQLRARIREGIYTLNTRKVPMRIGDRKRLIPYYAEDIRSLEGMLGVNLDAWKK